MNWPGESWEMLVVTVCMIVGGTIGLVVGMWLARP